jgi:peptidoglycan/LPS O-acetylase OafA/YrhL
MKQSSPTELSKYRPDIDGLRAIAVLAVMVFHAFPSGLKGGFIGVDIFFVISGYLIAKIIFENLDQQKFSFSEFYMRRIQRIFPALILVLVFCFSFGWFVLLNDEYKQLGKHIAAAAGFVSNVVLWNEADYFDNAADTKPLLHLWSLGVEEQFYFIWPLLLWVAWKRNFNILTITIIFAIASFILNVQGVKQDPTSSFYLLHTRFWELLSGSLLAWATLYKSSVFVDAKKKIDRVLVCILYRERREEDGESLPNVLSLLGLLLLGYGFWRIHNGLNFPGTWALIPVIGTIFLIVAGAKAWINRKILSNKVFVWIGLISFPLYLWHWPLLSFARIVVGETPDRNIRIAAVALSFLFAWLTYQFIEKPIRLSSPNKRKVLGLVVSMIAVGYLGYNVYSRDGLSFRLTEFNAKNSQILSQLGIPPNNRLRTAECENVFREFHDGLCVLKENKLPDILLFGDSYALQYYSGLSTFITDKNIGMLGAGWARAYGEPLSPWRGVYSEPGVANYLRQKEIFRIIESNPAIEKIIISCSPQYCSGVDFEKNMRATFDYLTSLNRKIYFIVGIPPLPFDPKLCLDIRPLNLSAKVKTPCGYPYSDYLSKNQNYRKIVFDVIANYPAVKIFDPSAVMCDRDYCYAIKGGQLLYRNDGTNSHLSDDGSHFVAPFLAKFLNEH